MKCQPLWFGLRRSVETEPQDVYVTPSVEKDWSKVMLVGKVLAPRAIDVAPIGCEPRMTSANPALRTTVCMEGMPSLSFGASEGFDLRLRCRASREQQIEPAKLVVEFRFL